MTHLGCAVFHTGQVKCWGSNQYGQSGFQDSTIRHLAVHMGDNLPFVDLGTGVLAKQVSCSSAYHTCIVTTTDQVKCWGYNGDGQLGYEDAVQRGKISNTMGDNLPFVNFGTGRTAKKVISIYMGRK